MTPAEIKDYIGDLNQEALVADGFDEALIGYIERATSGIVACYSREKCIEILMKRDGMTWEEATEFFDFNVAGAFVGETTPVFLTDLTQRQL